MPTSYFRLFVYNCLVLVMGSRDFCNLTYSITVDILEHASVQESHFLPFI